VGLGGPQGGSQASGRTQTFGGDPGVQENPSDRGGRGLGGPRRPGGLQGGTQAPGWSWVDLQRGPSCPGGLGWAPGGDPGIGVGSRGDPGIWVVLGGSLEGTQASGGDPGDQGGGT